MIARKQYIGCPCGHGFLDPCVIHSPLRSVDSSPCTQVCRSFDIGQIRYYARTIGVCPCNLDEAP